MGLTIIGVWLQEGHVEGYVALETIFGWVLSGPAPPDISIQDTPLTLLAAHTLKVEADNYQIDKQLKAFWDLESVPTEQSVYEEFTKTIRFTEGRYEVDLPWKDMHPYLPDNYRLCQTRLKGLLYRLRRNPEVLRRYNQGPVS